MVFYPIPFTFGTKAETIARLQPLIAKAIVPDFLFFTVRDWLADRKSVLSRITDSFIDTDIILRSSAVGEDSSASAMAGRFLSVPHVAPQDGDAVGHAVEDVIASYDAPGSELNDQILAQVMVAGVSVSGVLFTQDMNTGAPYYVINYDAETGRTDTVSAGNSEYSNRTLLVHRDSRHRLRSPRFLALLEAIDEVEAITENDCLDVEFAIDHAGKVYLFQIRQITTQPNWNRGITLRVNDALARAGGFVKQRMGPLPGINGSRSVLGKMPDWNPVEMIGTAPRPLALSLYRHLITDRAWRKARAQMGYGEPHGMPLMVTLAGQPFIDVRLSFHSFQPADLPARIGHKLVDAWIDRLSEHPQLHDKIEFDVAVTALAFDFEERVAAQFPGVLDADEEAVFRDCLQRLTRRLLTGEVAPIDGELRKIELLASNRKRLLELRDKPDAAAVAGLLEDCIELGTIPFAVLARHAFIANSFLKALLARGVLSESDAAQFQRSVPTVAGEFVRDVGCLSRREMELDDFMAHYGHLRPGTYDILSPRYDRHPELIAALPETPEAAREPETFALSGEQEKEIAKLLSAFGYEITPAGLLDYMAQSIRQREYAKFVFTRNLSDALEIIAAWGERNGLSREELSYIDIQVLLDTLSIAQGRSLEEYLRGASERGRESHGIAMAVQLPYLIFDDTDTVIVPLYLDQPNFVTRGVARGEPIELHGFDLPLQEIDRKIVAIESADPGFDWIFARPIAGLVTKFGGANSHMAIRCAEFGLPAAIGCGEQIFDRVVRSKLIELNCTEQRIVVLDS